MSLFDDDLVENEEFTRKRLKEDAFMAGCQSFFCKYKKMFPQNKQN